MGAAALRWVGVFRGVGLRTGGGADPRGGKPREPLAQSRIAPALYDALAQFAGGLDLLQQREVVFEKPGSRGVVSAR